MTQSILSAKQKHNNRLKHATDLVKNGQLDQAIISLKNILQEYPEDEISLGMLAATYFQINMKDKAAELYQQLLEISPENPLARFQLGMLELSSGSPEMALDTWAPLLKQNDEFMAHFHSGLALLQLNRTEEAQKLFIKAKQNMPESHPLFPKLMELIN